jgi:hypothetical protein
MRGGTKRNGVEGVGEESASVGEGTVHGDGWQCVVIRSGSMDGYASLVSKGATVSARLTTQANRTQQQACRSMQSCGSSVRDSLKIARRVVDEHETRSSCLGLCQALPLPLLCAHCNLSRGRPLWHVV